jgi:HK97 family phage portal protein
VLKRSPSKPARSSAEEYRAANRRLHGEIDLRSTLAEDLANAFPSNPTGTTGWQQGMVWAGYGSSGMVTNESAMRLSAVFACLRLLSEAIATLPLDTFERLGGTRRPYRPRPAYLSFDPPQAPRTEYLSALMLSLLTDGNAFVATPRDLMGSPIDLIVLDPTLVTVRRDGARPFFEVAGRPYSTLDIMHIKGMCMPGALRGVSPIQAARDVISWGDSAQQYGKSFMDNRAVPPAVIEMSPDSGNDPDAERTRALKMAQTWNDTHGGANNAGKIGVLLGGAKLSTVAISPEDAQWLESKKFGVSEIARFFGVPPHLIADASNSTSWGSGLAEQNLAFGQFSLRPWTERIEEAHGRLLTTDGLPTVFMRLNLDALLRSSLTDRYDSYATGISSQFLTVNEARALEDLPPVAWGNEPMSTPMPNKAPATSTGGAP